MFKISFHMKSGNVIEVVAEACDIKCSAEGLTFYSMKGVSVKHGQPLFIKITDIEAIISVPYKLEEE